MSDDGFSEITSIPHIKQSLSIPDHIGIIELYDTLWFKLKRKKPDNNQGPLLAYGQVLFCIC